MIESEIAKKARLTTCKLDLLRNLYRWYIEYHPSSLNKKVMFTIYADIMTSHLSASDLTGDCDPDEFYFKDYVYDTGLRYD